MGAAACLTTQGYMNLTGMSLKRQTIGMMTKYGFEINGKIIEQDLKRLVNQTWKIIPMNENNEDWIKQLETIQNEIIGLHEIFSDEPNFLIILTKIEGLLLQDIEFSFLRKTIFEIIALLQELSYGIKQV